MIERPIDADVYLTIRKLYDLIVLNKTDLSALIDNATQIANDALAAQAENASWLNEQW